MESSRPLRAASPPDEAPTEVHETEAIHPVTETESLAPALASSDQCASCGSQLAPDQHYCLVCGERRGLARFNAVPTSGEATTTITESRVPVRPPRFSSAATLIAGVATLLIAMGIGVYIGGLGKSNNSSSGQPVRVLTVGGGSAGSATTPTTAANGSGSGAGSRHKKSAGAKQSASAAKVVTTVKNLPPPTVTIGARGSGKGYQKGKFTGHFFGP